MHYRRLGKTGYDVSAISFGAWAIGGTWGAVNDEDSLAALHRALDAAAAVHRDGVRNAEGIRSSALAVLADAGIDPEYLELRDADTLAAVERVDRDALLLVAARVGAARLRRW